MQGGCGLGSRAWLLAAALMITLCHARAAHAQRGIDVQRFVPALDPSGFLAVQGTQTPGSMQSSFGLFLDYQKDALEAAVNWYRAGATPGASSLAIDVPPVAVPTLYLWGDADATVAGSGYFADGVTKGMRVGDIVDVVATTGPKYKRYQVASVSGDAATVAAPTAIT